MRLLFITQKIHANDDDLAFIILWIKEFIKQGLEVEVICLEKGDFDNSFSVHSLGKEAGRGKITRLLRFLKLITTLQYDAVFVHMNPEYFTYGGWWWFVRGTPAYLWYTHYTMTLHMFLAGILARSYLLQPRRAYLNTKAIRRRLYWDMVSIRSFGVYYQTMDVTRISYFPYIAFRARSV